jgi:HRAS-like suppressor 3
MSSNDEETPLNSQANVLEDHDFEILNDEDFQDVLESTQQEIAISFIKKSESNEKIRLEHNKKVLEDIQPGDLLEFKRNIYSHWAVYIGHEKIIHLTGENDEMPSFITVSGVLPVPRFERAQVSITNFWDCVQDSLVFRNNSLDEEFMPLPVDQILVNAFKKVSDTSYNLIWYNCEHFAKYCRYGIESCSQTIQIFKLIKFGYTVTRGLKNFKDNSGRFLSQKSSLFKR